MSDTSKTEIPIETVKKPKAVEEKSDTQLSAKEATDLFWIQRIFKWFLLVLVIIVLSYFTYVTIVYIMSNDKLLNELIHKIIDNIVVIICTSFSILGINFAYKK